MGFRIKMKKLIYNLRLRIRKSSRETRTLESAFAFHMRLVA